MPNESIRSRGDSLVNFSNAVLGTPLLAFALVTAVAALLVVVLDRGLGWFRPAAV